ncbi:PHD finger protein 20 isoform X2 [Salminus brasiliensis]|uniref:PHD finger protein 20 isoform X2 n=1 Tax=Salminus brasiliensis TaxID=930266 RepID=UPI003B83176C
MRSQTAHPGRLVFNSRENSGEEQKAAAPGEGSRSPAASLEPPPLTCGILAQAANSMSKTPPNRRGITFEVGAAIEARDSLKNWYAANIEKIDYEDEKVLIHYRQWSHRYDEWFDWTSPYLRPVERVQLRREGLHEDCSVPGFHVNDKVLASWSDCRFYPAKVLSVNKDASYTVKFYDGVVQTVKGMHVKPFINERIRQKSTSSGRSGEKILSRSAEKHLRQLGSSSCKSRRAPPCTFQQDSENDSEEEDGDSDEWSQRKADTMPVQKNTHTDGAESVLLKEESVEEESERVAEHIGQHNYSKAFVKKTSLNREQEEKSGTDMEYSPYSDLDEGIENKDVKKEAEHADGSEEEEEEEEEESPPQNKTSQGLPIGGKKRSSVRQGGAFYKKIKTESYSDKNVHDEPRLSPQLSEQRLTGEGQECAPLPSAHSSSGVVTLKNGQSEALNNPLPAKLRKQGFHNPNRFSREPLYRVIKNQPPPVLSINLDHNPFKCSSPGCSKSFRKAKLLHYHMKYYHGDDRPIDEGLSPSTSIHPGVKEKQVALDSWENPKQRCGVSVSLPTHSTSQSPPSSKAEGRNTAQIAEKRRASAPSAVHVQEQQVRPLLKEKSRENQLDRNGRRTVEKSREKSPMDTARVNRCKERKSRGFLHIKLKKKKKKKKSKSGSEENIDISVFGLQSKLNLPLKSPLSRKHPAEALHSRPGHGQADRLEVDDEDSISDWSSDSYGWSDDETRVDLDISCGSVALATDGQEIVRCICEAEDENDFMIQCEECLCWQHGTCMGLLEESVPDRYACFVCRDPTGQTCGQRQSLRYWYDHEWLSSGHMYGLSFLEENYSHQNARKIAATHQLLGDIQHVVEVLNGLQLKMSVLQNQTHPDLKLWCQPWKQTERGQQKTFKAERTTGSFQQVLHRTESKELSQIPSSSFSFQNSYISSEHCYQKPWAYYPALEERLVVERWGGSELEDRLQGSKRVPQYKEHYGGEHQSSQARANREEVLDHCARMVGSGEELRSSTQQQQWQINLLEHIESVQEEITHRMDFIERELDVLESWLDYTGELEPPEPLERLPELKHSIKHLMVELEKVQQIAQVCAT